MFNKPHKFFFFLMPVFFVAGLLGLKKSIDISFFSSYLVVRVSHWFFLATIFCALIGINYFLITWAKKKPNKILSIIHILLQSVASLPFLICLYVLSSSDYLENESFNTFDFYGILYLSFIIFLISIVVHIFNFFLSLFQKD